MSTLRNLISLALIPAIALSSLGQANDLTFTRVKRMITLGGKVKETNIVLTLTGESIRLENPSGRGGRYTFIPYADIKAATYSRSKHPRWKEGIGVALAVGIFAIPVFFMKSKKHWLTIQTDKDSYILRLDKNNFRPVTSTLEARLGKTLEKEIEGVEDRLHERVKTQKK